MTDTRYRDALLSDAAAIIEFQLAMARETEELELDREILTRGVQALFDDPSLGRYFVAERDGEVAGSLMITYEWSDWRNGMVWWIQSVYVTPRSTAGAGSTPGSTRTYARSSRPSRTFAASASTSTRRNISAQEVYTRLGMDGGHYQVFEWMKSQASV